MIRTGLGACICALLVAPLAAQQPAPSTTSKTPTPITLTGCVSAKPGASGQYMFAEAEGPGEYRLNGKDISKFAGQRVEIVGGSGSGSGLTIRGGLWPAARGGARGVALDPAQESISRQPGASGPAGDANLPELKVTRLKAVEGVCETRP